VIRLPVFAAARRRAIVWLLVCLVLIQGMAAGVLTTLGPAHTHKVASRVVVLEDFRRAPSGAISHDLHVLTAIGHFHRPGADRHYHARSDHSVVLTDAGSPLTDDNDGAISPVIAFVAPLPAELTWRARHSSVAATAPLAWVPVTDDPEALYRPPQRS